MKREKKGLTRKTSIIILNETQKVINAFESGIFPKTKQGKRLTSFLGRIAQVARGAKVSDYEVSDHKQLKILTPKQMLQRLSIALAQVKAGNTSENLLNETGKSYIFLSRKKITKKVYGNIMNSIKL